MMGDGGYGLKILLNILKELSIMLLYDFSKVKGGRSINYIVYGQCVHFKI